MRILMIFIALTCLLTACASHDPYLRLARRLSAPSGKVLRVGVLPFAYPASNRVGEFVAERLVEKLSGTEKIEVIERHELTRLQKELELQVSGNVDPKSVKSLGRLLGADALVIGKIYKTRGGRLDISARLVDVESGRVISADHIMVSDILVEEQKRGDALVVDSRTEARPLPYVSGTATHEILEGMAKDELRHDSHAGFGRGTFSGWGVEILPGEAGGLSLVPQAGSATEFNTIAGVLPEPFGAHGTEIWGGRLYVIGGMHINGKPTSSVYSTAIRPSGELGSWRPEASLPVPAYGLCTVVWNGFLYAVGGYGGSYRSEAYFARISQNGRLAGWAKTASLPTPGYRCSMAAVDGRLYVGGGYGGKPGPQGIYVADVRPDGSLRDWTQVPARRRRDDAILAAGRKKIFLTGGYEVPPRSFASMTSFSWENYGLLWDTEEPALPYMSYAHGFSPADGRLFMVGGVEQTGPTLYNAIYSAPVSQTGVPGKWEKERFILPGLMMSFGRVPYWNGRLYVVGGAFHAEKAPGYDTEILRDVSIITVSRAKTLVDYGLYYNSMDMGRPMAEGRLSWNSKLNGGSLDIWFRTASRGGYGSWRKAANGEKLTNARFLEYKVVLMPSENGRSPILHAVEVRRLR